MSLQSPDFSNLSGAKLLGSAWPNTHASDLTQLSKRPGKINEYAVLNPGRIIRRDVLMNSMRYAAAGQSYRERGRTEISQEETCLGLIPEQAVTQRKGYSL